MAGRMWVSDERTQRHCLIPSGTNLYKKVSPKQRAEDRRKISFSTFEFSFKASSSRKPVFLQLIEVNNNSTYFLNQSFGIYLLFL